MAPESEGESRWLSWGELGLKRWTVVACALVGALCAFNLFDHLRLVMAGRSPVRWGSIVVMTFGVAANILGILMAFLGISAYGSPRITPRPKPKRKDAEEIGSGE